MNEQPAPVLSVRSLAVTFATAGGVVRALEDVSFDVPAGGAVGLVGESGCGKSVTALSIMRLVPTPPGKIERGEIVLEGRDLLTLDERELCAIRGARIGMVFQEPMTSLNPVYTVGAQIAEAIRLHRSVSRADARQRALELLGAVGIPRPEERLHAYPHELSGGMRQRVMIAIAIACDPAVLVADEPTSALDVTVQAQILELIDGLRGSSNMALLLISHDLAVVADAVDEIVVLYAGTVVEQGASDAVLRAPQHPYTRALIRSIPGANDRGFRVRGTRRKPLPTIPGTLPDLRFRPPGCAFYDRCAERVDRCRDEEPPLYAVGGGRVRCFLHASTASEQRAEVAEP